MLQNTLRLRRLEQELTQSQLAEMVGVTRQTIAFIEKGEFSPSILLALKLADSLNVPITELFWLHKEEASA